MSAISDESIVAQFQSLLKPDEKLLYYVYAYRQPSISFMFTIGPVAALTMKFFYLGVTDKRLLISEVDMLMKPEALTAIDFSQLKGVRAKKGILANSLKIVTVDGKTHIFSITNRAGGLKKQGENAQAIIDFFSRFPVYTPEKLITITRTQVISTVLTTGVLYLLSLPLVLVLRYFFPNVSPIYVIGFLCILAIVMTCARLKKNIRIVGAFSGATYGALLSFTVILVNLTSPVTGSPSSPLITLIIFLFLGLLLGYIVGFVYGVITRQNRYEDFLF